MVLPLVETELTDPVSEDCLLRSDRDIARALQAEAAARGDVAALVASVEGTIRKVVREFSYGLRPHEIEDLVAAGRLGAVVAARRYDPAHERGANFNTYAVWWIRACVTIELFFFRSKGRCRRSRATTQVLYGYSRACRTLESLGQSPDVGAIASALGVSERALRDAASTFFSADCNYDDPISPGHHTRISETVADESSVDPFSSMSSVAEASCLRDVVANLPERYRVVVEQVYFEGKTIASVARDLGVTRERARQIQMKALAILRKRLERRLAA